MSDGYKDHSDYVPPDPGDLNDVVRALDRVQETLFEIALELQISNRRTELAEAVKTRTVLDAQGRALHELEPLTDYGRACLQRSEDNRSYLDGLRMKLAELIRSRDE